MATTIQVGTTTRDELKAIGHKGETYDSVIRRLLRASEYVAFMDEQYAILSQDKGWKKLQDIP